MLLEPLSWPRLPVTQPAEAAMPGGKNGLKTRSQRHG